MFAIVPILVELDRDDDFGGNLHTAVIFLCTVSTDNFEESTPALQGYQRANCAGGCVISVLGYVISVLN